MIERAGKERLAPMLMTALTAGIALLPLILEAGEPGKEILYPVATVILGGVISSTLLDFFVHPALFWLFGLKAAQRVVSEHDQQIPLVEPHEEAAGQSAHPAPSSPHGASAATAHSASMVAPGTGMPAASGTAQNFSGPTKTVDQP